MQVVPSAHQLVAQLQAEDLVVRPMPAAGIMIPGARDAVVTGDGIVIVDEGGKPLYFVTNSGLVIGSAANIFRDGKDAQSVQARQTQQQADS